MYNHTLIYQTEQQARKAERALMYTRIDCSNVHVSDQAQLSFQTTCKLEELARLKLRSELQATGSSFNVWEAPYEAGLRAIDGRQQQAPLFTEQARTVLRLAQEEAQRFHHNYIGTEHLLLALLGEGEGVAARVLTSLGVDLQKAREAVAFIIGYGHGSPEGSIPLTPRAQSVIKLALGEARRMDQYAIGTEHLLLGLTLEGEGIGVGVLESLGVSLEKVRRRTSEVLSPFGMPDVSDEESLNGCPYCEDLEEGETDIIGDILLFLEQLGKFLIGAVLCLVATLLLLFFAIVARFILFLLELCSFLLEL